MWIFLNNAYLSIVRHRERPDHLLVRARNNGDIQAVFPQAEVDITPHADYLFRAVISEDEVINAISWEVSEIDYDNFKNSIVDQRYHDACMGVWVTMNDYQREGTYQRDRKHHAKKKN